MSSSDDLEVALDFLIPPNPQEQEVVFQFVTRDYIDLRSISEWEEESEFLINSGSEMYIKKIISGKNLCLGVNKKIKKRFRRKDIKFVFACENKDCNGLDFNYKKIAKKYCKKSGKIK